MPHYKKYLLKFLLIALFIVIPTVSNAWTFIYPPKKANIVSTAHTVRAFQLFDNGNQKKSLEHLEKAILEAEDCCRKEKGTNSIFYWNLAVYYEKNGLFKTAKPYFKYARRFLIFKN